MNEVENDFVKFWFENGILFSKFQKDTELDIESIKQAIEMREQISGQQKQYWLYDVANLKIVTKEARHYAVNYGENFICASAVLVNSFFTKFIFNSYLKLNKPDFPFFCFTNKEKAIEWLLEIKVKNEQI